MDYSLKTISIGISRGDLNFTGLRGHFDKLRTGCFFQASYTFCYKFRGITPGAHPGAFTLKVQITGGFSGISF
jgi:hypothetical protein